MMAPSDSFNMKNSHKAVVLIEVILSIIITAVIVINAMIIFKEFHALSEDEFDIELHKLELRNTQYFLEKNITTHNKINKIKLVKQTLFYDNHLLLKNVSEFKLYEKYNRHFVKICINNQICEEFIF